MAMAEMAFGGGLNSSSGGELKLYLRCTGSTNPHHAFSGRGEVKTYCVIVPTFYPPKHKA